jgi:catechol 2,3-dioxygenase-like lactoylglutathione lyase family enzyme
MGPVRIDAVEIGVADVAEACAAYALLLGVEPDSEVPGRIRFQLGRGAVELVPGGTGLQALSFVAERDESQDLPDSFHGVDVRVRRGEASAPATNSAAAQTIDHVVIQSSAPERAIALWRDRLGLRLALDRVFPERGLRLIFFRSGGVTLEIASVHPAPAGGDGPDRLWGVSYRVGDLATHRARLLAAGVDVSEIRPGMRPGTSVATVRSGTAGVPTLFLEVLS